MHDENYKKIFAFPRVIEDLLRAFVPGDWLQEVNFATLDKLSTEYISDELLKRHGDNVWRMRLRKNWLYLLLLVEFQSTDDPLMALRILTYTGLLYQELARNGQLDAEGRLPAVLPLVLYNGDEPWESPLQMGELIAPVGPLLAPYQPAQRYFVLDERRLHADDLPSRNRMSAVIGLEQSRSPRDVARVAEMLAAWLPDLQVRRAFADWMRQIVERLVPSGVELPPIRKLEDVSMTLVERAAEWSKEWPPPNSWRSCWRRSPTRSVWPTSAIGWCSATPAPTSSPASVRRRPEGTRTEPEPSWRGGRHDDGVPWWVRNSATLGTVALFGLRHRSRPVL